MTRKSVAISKVAVIVLAGFCLPLAACSKAGGNGEVAGATASGKGKASPTGWMNGAAKKSGKQADVSSFSGAKKGSGGSKKNTVEIPKVGGKSGKKKGA